jgi:hypothetical protein
VIFAQDGVLTHDGVAVIARGDTFSIVYQRAARLHRTRWLFEQLDAFAATRAGDFQVLMIVLPTADPPDGPTRAENAAGLRRLGHRLRRLVTVPVGDTFQTTIVRVIMRALAALQGKSGVHFIVSNVDEGIRRTRESATDATPSSERLHHDLRSLHAALGVSHARPSQHA